MASAWRFQWTCGAALLVGLALPLATARADDAGAAADGASVEMFDGMKSGDLDVKFIPKNSMEAQVIITNNTHQPLSVKLPDAFAGVPILAQNAVGGAGGANRTRTGGNNGGGNQGVGGGMGGVGGGQGGQQRGGGGVGGAFDVAPEKVAKINLAADKSIKFKVMCVCLDHGKAEPNARVPYEIRPIETYSSDPKVQELCKLLGEGHVNQQAAQAAAWHLANHLTWEELTNKKIHHLIGGDEIYFSADEIKMAMKIADAATKMADARPAVSAGASSTKAPDTTDKSSGKN